MSAEAISATLSGVGQAGAAGSAGYGFSLADVSGFESAMARASQANAAGAPQPAAASSGATSAQAGPTDLSAATPKVAGTSKVAGAPAIQSPAMQSLIKPFEHLSAEAAQLSAKAKAISASGMAMTPGDMIMLTVRCQEFMFHCQLTSNVANRTSDGLQQLFRQQG